MQHLQAPNIEAEQNVPPPQIVPLADAGRQQVQDFDMDAPQAGEAVFQQAGQPGNQREVASRPHPHHVNLHQGKT